MGPAPDLFTWEDGRAYFRGHSVEHGNISFAGLPFRIARLKDAAALLDEPDFAQRFVEEDRAPYGVELWPGALMLAEHILNGEDGHGRSALELGCGLGLVSLAAARKGWHITATDYEPIPLEFARYNAALNDAPVAAFELLDWNHPPVGRRVERIFGADILYQLVDHEPILRCIAALMAPGGSAWLSDPFRGVADRVAALAEAHGFQVLLLPAIACAGSKESAIQGRLFVLTRP
ncbi:MAG: methyltransferase domain-containing protein [Planctomycetes bacterium]|nr:methyltransferase domain-containing protein [Planctomycetota bacterium]